MWLLTIDSEAMLSGVFRNIASFSGPCGRILDSFHLIAKRVSHVCNRFFLRRLCNTYWNLNMYIRTKWMLKLCNMDMRCINVPFLYSICMHNMIWVMKLDFKSLLDTGTSLSHQRSSRGAAITVPMAVLASKPILKAILFADRAYTGKPSATWTTCFFNAFLSKFKSWNHFGFPVLAAYLKI